VFTIPLANLCFCACGSVLVKGSLQASFMLSPPFILLLCCLTLLDALFQLALHAAMLFMLQCFQAAMLGNCNIFHLRPKPYKTSAADP
jgi:hypothetical protein